MSAPLMSRPFPLFPLDRQTPPLLVLLVSEQSGLALVYSTAHISQGLM